MESKNIFSKDNEQIEGPLILKPKIFEDDRGYFYESFNQEKFNKITKSNKVRYLKDEKSLNDLILKNLKTEKKGSSNKEKLIQEEKQKLSIQRFKGLGEMNPEELWETTLNPENRTLLRVQYSKGTKAKSKEDQKIIEILMGDNVAPRKEFITNNALNVENLDI